MPARRPARPRPPARPASLQRARAAVAVIPGRRAGYFRIELTLDGESHIVCAFDNIKDANTARIALIGRLKREFDAHAAAASIVLLTKREMDARRARLIAEKAWAALDADARAEVVWSLRKAPGWMGPLNVAADLLAALSAPRPSPLGPRVVRGKRGRAKGAAPKASKTKGRI